MVNIVQDTRIADFRSGTPQRPPLLTLEKSELTARIIFFVVMTAAIGGTALLSVLWPVSVWALLFILPVFALGVHDIMQRKKTVLRIYPVIGHVRYMFEAIRPEIQQYFVESDTSGTPFSREYRALVYQRAKKQCDTRPFGTIFDVYKPGYEWVNHSIAPKTLTNMDPRIVFGGPQCNQPYSASALNISAMSYGALSKNAILALNKGAKIGGFAHNTGEGGISPYHLKYGGDLIWQIGTGYFGCRDKNGNFDPVLFSKKAVRQPVKMIEIKLSQGAKPGHGGIGKPVGFKLCIGSKSEFLGICKAMLETGITPDFITIDGSEGGTGAAPIEMTNSVGMPLREALVFVHNALNGIGLRQHVKLIASGKAVSAFHMLRLMALGADTVNSARAMMMALGLR